MSDLCACGKESEFGCHGITQGEIYDEYYCEACYNIKKRGGTTTVEEKEEQIETSTDRRSSPQDNQIRLSQTISGMAEQNYSGAQA